MILCCKYCPLWQKTSVPISDSVRQKELPPPKQEESASADHQHLYRRTSTTYTNNGKMAKSQEQLLQSCAGCHFLPSAIVQRFTKKPSCCKRVFLQESVLFCKCSLFIIPLIIAQRIIGFHTKTSSFPLLRSIFTLIEWGVQKVHLLENALEMAQRGGEKHHGSYRFEILYE